METENKARELAIKLNCRNYTQEITKEEASEAKESGLIVIFGSSDDLVEFKGAITEELNDGIILLIPKGIKVMITDEDEGESWEEGGEEAIAIQLKDDAEMGKNRIEAEYSQECVWSFKTEIPHHIFNIFDDGDPYCVGIVIDEKDLL